MMKTTMPEPNTQAAFEEGRSLFMLGIQHTERDELTTAEVCFRQSLALVPDRPASLDNLAACLLRQGRLDEAEQFCRQSIGLNDAGSAPWFSLGMIHTERGRTDDALGAFRKFMERGGDTPEAWLVVGILLKQKKQFADSISAMERVLGHIPGKPEAICLLGEMFGEIKLFFSAMAVLDRGIEIHPDYHPFYKAKANILVKLNRKAEAIDYYRKVLTFEGADREIAAYELSALTGEKTFGKSPKQYISNLFDEFAASFETHMMGKLNYRTPERLCAILAEFIADNDLDIIDLGCGTGLAGLFLKPFAKHLVGLDLSSKMLTAAADKHVYDDLVCEDIEQFLSANATIYDLVVAADVFVYIGDLSGVFSCIAARLKQDGIFAFTVEALIEGESYRLNESKRYSHSEIYCRKLAEEFGFEVEFLNLEFLRLESTAPDGKINGFYIVLRKL